MLKTLVITRLKFILFSMFKGKNPDKRKKANPALKILFGILAVYVIIAFLFMFGGLFFMICEPLCTEGYSWLYFTIVAIISVLLSVFGNLFFVKSEIYESKDNTLLLSMPIPPSKILASRLISVIIISCFYQALVTIPAAFVYTIAWKFTAVGFVNMLIGFALLPFLGLTISLLIGALMAYLDTLFVKKNIMTLILSILFLIVYLWVYTGIQKYINALLANADVVAGFIKRYSFTMYCFGHSISGANPVDLFIFLAAVIIPFLMVYSLLSISYIRLLTTARGAKKIKYKRGELAVSSPFKALCNKEIKRFTSSALYMMNGGIGLIFVLAAAVALPFVRGVINDLSLQIPGIEKYYGLLAIAVACGLLTMVMISAPTVSLEGKYIWITKSLPVSVEDILFAKVYPHLMLGSVPTLLFSLSAVIFLNMSLPMRLLVIVVPLAFNAAMAFFGVVINLIFPRLEWINEVVPIKQGISVMFAMLFGMVTLSVPGVVYALLLRTLMPAELFAFIYLIVLCVMIYLFYRYLKNGGKRRFEAL